MEENTTYRAHCLVLAFPGQGHINPMFQFSKRLQHKGIKVTFVTTRFILKAITTTFSSPVLHHSNISIKTISDGFDEGGIKQAESKKAYFNTFRKVGSETVTNLITKLNASGLPVSSVVYNSFLPWGLDVAKKLGMVAAPFFTQTCAVGSIYYHAYKGELKLPLAKTEIMLPGLPPLESQNMPTFMNTLEESSDVLNMVLEQFSNVDGADWVLFNTVYELESEVVDWMAKLWPLKTIGPTIPSMYLDNRLQDDKDYDFNMFNPNSEACINWLNDKSRDSVLYVSFGSLAEFNIEQMTELSWGIKRCECNFLWIVRATEEEKLPKNFKEETKERGLVVSWCPQLQVLSHEAIGCFLTHCGWNSTLEALNFGVPMVTMPYWSDQSTNAKFISDVWRVGVMSLVDEKEVVR